MIRILYCIATLDPFGAERQLASLACGLDRNRFEPTICCLTRGGELESELKGAGIEVIILRKCCKFDFSVLASIMKLIRSRRIDIVHTWLFTANAFGRTGAALAHAPAIVASERSMDPWKGLAYRLIDRSLALVTDAVVCNSMRVQENCRESLGVPEEKLHVIHNGVEIGSIAARRGREEVRHELGVQAGEYLICAAGRLSPEKQFDLFIHAAAVLAGRRVPVRAVVAGEGELRGRLENKIVSLGLRDRVRLIGYRADLHDIVAASDVFALCSSYEGLPNVVLEAMALGTPVVASDVGGVPDLITDGVTGRIIAEPVTPASIAAAVESVLTGPDRGRGLAERARARVAEDFTLDKMIARHEQLYEDLMHARRRSGDTAQPSMPRESRSTP